MSVQHGADIGASGTVILWTSGSNFKAAHDIRQTAGVREIPVLCKPIQQSGTVGVAAAGRVDDLGGFDGIYVSLVAVCVQGGAFTTTSDDDRKQGPRNIGHTA